MASTKKHKMLEQGKHEAKKAKIDEVTESSGSKPTKRVVLNPADCNIDFNIEGEGLQGSALYEGWFGHCWSGARANVGITGGKYCFGCKIISWQHVMIMTDTEPNQKNICRIGISGGNDNVGFLGETEDSFGFDSTGIFYCSGKVSDQFDEKKFGIGDTIVCAVNLEDKSSRGIDFFKNRKLVHGVHIVNARFTGLDVVESTRRMLQRELALFPHVLLKNVVVQLQFSVEEGLVLEKGYKPWASALENGNAFMGPTLSETKNCELIMMVGLPASGKTTWAENCVKENPENRYVLLGTNLVLDQMRVPESKRRQIYGKGFDPLWDRATGIYNTLLSRAAKIPRNYIIDQTNVEKIERWRIVQTFTHFKKIAVVVFPTFEELKSRSDKRFKETGKQVPADVVNKMIANFDLPGCKNTSGSYEFYDEVMYTELSSIESYMHLEEARHATATAIATASATAIATASATASAPNLNSNNHSSPHPREGSIQSYTRFTPQCQVTEGHRQSSYPPPLLSNYQGPNQAYATHLGAEAYLGNQYPPIRVAAPSGTYTSYESSLPRADTGYSGRRYGGTPSGGTTPNWDYRMGEPYNSLNIEANNAIPGPVTDPYRSSMVAPPPFVSASTLAFSHSSHGLQAPRAPMVPYRSSMIAPPPFVSAIALSFSHSSHGLQAPRAPIVPYRSSMVVTHRYVSASTLPFSHSSHGLQAPRAPMVPYRSSMIAPPPFVSASTLSFSHSSHGLQAPRAPMVPYRSSMVVPPLYVSASTLPFSHSSHGLQAPRAPMVEPHRSGMVAPPPYASMSQFAHSSHGGHFSNSGGPQANLQAPRAPLYLPGPPPVTYGSPYGTPSQRQRPPDGSIPTDMRYSGGNFPPPTHPR